MYKIRGKDIDKSPAVISFFESKIEKLKRFKNVDLNEVKVEFVYYSKEELYKCRINLLIGSKIYRTESSSADIRTAIDESIEKLIDQLRRIKTENIRRREVRRKSVKKINDLDI